MVQPSTIAEQLRTNMDGFTPSERKIARVLLANYPMVGLDTIAQFAAHTSAAHPSCAGWLDSASTTTVHFKANYGPNLKFAFNHRSHAMKPPAPKSTRTISWLTLLTSCTP